MVIVWMFCFAVSSVAYENTRFYLFSSLLDVFSG